MKTTISIEARRFPVTLRDERTGDVTQEDIPYPSTRGRIL